MANCERWIYIKVTNNKSQSATSDNCDQGIPTQGEN